MNDRLPRNELMALTSIRGIAAWFVVLFHVRVGAQAQIPPILFNIASKGYLAVDLFFMLSGFVLWLNYSDRLRGRGAAAAGLFLARRIARIWPLHIFMLACIVAFALLRVIKGAGFSDHYPWSELPLHVLLVQNWGFTDHLTWNDPAWSISCEFAACLLFPLLILTCDWRRVSNGGLILLLLLLASTLHLIMGLAGFDTLGQDIPHLGLPRALIEFTMGTILCTLWSRWRGSRPLARLSTAATLALGTAAVTGVAPESVTVPLTFAALLLAISLVEAGRFNPLRWRWIHYLGEISYATYLAHFLLYIAFKLLFVHNPANVPLPLLGLFLILVLLTSIALHHGLERPAQRALNGAIGNWGSLRAARAGTV